MVSDWVDNELIKIKSTLSQEVFEALDGNNGGDYTTLPFILL